MPSGGKHPTLQAIYTEYKTKRIPGTILDIIPHGTLVCTTA